MPTMNARTLVRALRVISPAVKIVVVRGMVEVNAARELVTPGNAEVLAKAFTGQTLLESVHRRLTGA
jgi:FixJ family two-component response regulator